MKEYIEITCKSPGKILDYCREEAQKYLHRMYNDKKSRKIILSIGLFKDFNLKETGSDNSTFDDEIDIQFKDGRGIIAGNNERSTLISLYRFLREAGCLWVRPGEDGEYIPSVNLYELDIKVKEKASYRHRGICIEGANSYENIEKIIDWAPKAGFNSYFFQFKEAYTFFDRWYSHTNNPTKEPEEFNVETARKFLKDAEAELEKRGMIYHAIGHGWTCEPFGVPGLSWDKTDYEIDEKTKMVFAQVNGKRELWGGVPLNTNLCYSDVNVRNTITDAITEHLIEHGNIDVLHFWLADGSNNQCECDNCKNTLPSDYYVMMLNDLDRKLTKKNIDTKVVFLIYVDLLWAPEKEKINNPDRFILMFAPITRSYSRSFSVEGELPATKPFIRNKLQFPRNVSENIAYLKSWENVFKGDSFDFDYHFMWDHYLDPGYFKNAEILWEDIGNLEKINLNGFVSCQTQRAFFPTGLGMHVMGSALWDKEKSFESITREYFMASFGDEWEKIMLYLKKLSLMFDSPALRKEKELDKSNYSSICTFIGEYRSVIMDLKKKYKDDIVRKASYRYLELHADLNCIFALVLEAKAEGLEEKARSIWKLAERFVQEHEDELQIVLDSYLYIHTLRGRIGLN